MQKQWLPVRLGLCALGLLALLSACGKTEVGLSKTAADYETMSYAEFKEQTGNEAEFYHEIRYIGEIPASPVCVIFEGEYDPEQEGPVLTEDSQPIRLQGPLSALLDGIPKEVTLTQLAEALSANGAAKAVLERLEGAGTAYYIGNDYAVIQFDSDQDGELDRLLSISLDESIDAAIDPKSVAWLEIDRQVN